MIPHQKNPNTKPKPILWNIYYSWAEQLILWWRFVVYCSTYRAVGVYTLWDNDSAMDVLYLIQSIAASPVTDKTPAFWEPYAQSVCAPNSFKCYSSGAT